MKGSLAEITQHSISLRPVLPEDADFLYEVYACTRADELAHVAWDEAQRTAFLKMQLKARDHSYRMHYAEFDDQIILVNGKNAGRLMIVRTGEEIRLADITLMPDYRGNGLGASLIKNLVAEADSAGKPLRLQVELSNERARRLYERLGFNIVGDNLTHVQMEYQPGSTPTT